MRMVAAIAVAACVSMLALLGAGAANAAEIKVLISNALKSTMEELAPQFEKATENKLVITFGAAAELKTSIEKGAAIDLAILTTATTDDLVKEGKLVAAGRTDIARAGAGLAARKGAPKPAAGWGLWQRCTAVSRGSVSQGQARARLSAPAQSARILPRRRRGRQ
jgi:molybdate transport system substrate-binding protein